MAAAMGETYSSSGSSPGVSVSFLRSERSFSTAAISLSRWALTEAYSPPAIEIDPAIRAATPAISIGPLSTVAPATPITIPAVETMPSLAPKTPARSQLSLRKNTLFCSCSGSIGFVMGLFLMV